MKEKENKATQPDAKPGSEKKNNVPGYPLYPDSEDIYRNSHEEENIDPEDTSEIREPGEKNKTVTSNEKNFDDNVSGSDLDVPGSELDDEQEKVGSEDEENNYYSLGGDNHNNLEEDKGE